MSKNIKEYLSEDIDRVVIEEDTKKVKIVLEDGRRILVDCSKIIYLD